MKRGINGKLVCIVACICFAFTCTKANLKQHPVTFSLSLSKPSYYEGDRITLLITITNTDKENSHRVLLPHTQNVGQKLFYLNVYDKAENTQLLRYAEEKTFSGNVRDTGKVIIKLLKPLEQVVVPIYLNGDKNGDTEVALQHGFDVPLFAGVYKLQLVYQPNGITLGDSIYSYYNDFDKITPASGKLLFPETGIVSPALQLKIKRSSDTLVTIEGQNYFIKTNGHYYFYFNQYVETITTDWRCVHITSLLPDSCSTNKVEYFYSQFKDLHNEYVLRFEDGDIKEYRRFAGYCPDYLFTEKFNDFKQKILHQERLPDKRFYSISYHQPSGTINEENYCSSDGTLCNTTTYVYDKNGQFLKKKVTQTQPCVEIELEGRKRSVKRVTELQGN